MTRPSSDAATGHDWRLPVLAAIAWGGALLGLCIGRWATLALPLAAVLVAVLATTSLRRDAPSPGAVRRWTAMLLVVGAVFCFLAAVRSESATQRVVAALAKEPRAVHFVGSVRSDPSVIRSGFADRERILVAVDEARRGPSASGASTWSVRDSLVLIGDPFEPEAQLGARVRFAAVPLPPHREGQVRETRWALRGELQVLEPPDVWWRAAEAMRASLRGVVAERGADQRALVPSLVVGDDSLVSEELEDAFRVTGLTHLLAVSGTNLTLLMGVVLGVGTWCGVRGRWRLLLGAACIAGFVLVARSEPSVIRAATMGAVAVLALERHATDRGFRCLGAAVLLVLAADPWMATSIGLALSVLATAGILVLTPVWARAMGQWMPRWAALCLAVPLAAQWAVTPVVTTLQGEISVVAVAANVAVAPAVAPATVLGLLAGLVGLAHPGLGQLVALPAAWSVGWIATVARWGAGTAVPAVPWGTGVGWMAVLTMATGVGVLVMPALLRRWWVVLPATAVLAWIVVRGMPTPGWPPHGWIVAACDVGQGDAVVVRTGADSAMVVDAGPESGSVDRCLDRLGVRVVDVVVLTHFHADHIDGLPGVLSGRTVRAVEVSPEADPPSGAAQVLSQAEQAGVPVRTSLMGTTTRLGDATVQRLWPETGTRARTPSSGGEGDRANDASVVLWVEVDGVSVLLTGDVEPPAQRRLARVLQGIEVDVLKVPHHGSRHQDDRFLAGLSPQVALVSSGADNTYGHPAPELLADFEAGGTTVLRTDQSGDVVVVNGSSGLGTTSLRRGH